MHEQLVPQGNGDLRLSLRSNQSLSHVFHVLRKLTFTSLKSPDGQEQQIYRLFVLLNRPVNLIHIADQTRVFGDEGEFAIWVQSLALVDDTSASFLRATDQIDARRGRILRESSHCGLTNSICRTNENSDESGRKSGCDSLVRGAHRFEG